jgi:hypothetical protein
MVLSFSYMYPQAYADLLLLFLLSQVSLRAWQHVSRKSICLSSSYTYSPHGLTLRPFVSCYTHRHPLDLTKVQMQTAKANDKSTIGFIGGIVKQHGEYSALAARVFSTSGSTSAKQDAKC